MKIINKLIEDTEIRELLAFIIVVLGFSGLVYIAVSGNQNAMEVLKSILLIVVGYYFGHKTKTNKKNSPL